MICIISGTVVLSKTADWEGLEKRKAVNGSAESGVCSASFFPTLLKYELKSSAIFSGLISCP